MIREIERRKLYSSNLHPNQQILDPRVRYLNRWATYDSFSVTAPLSWLWLTLKEINRLRGVINGLSMNKKWYSMLPPNSISG